MNTYSCAHNITLVAYVVAHGSALVAYTEDQHFNKAMRHLLQSSFKWVPGHQNREKSLEELYYPARMNVEADRLAGEHNDSYGAFDSHDMRIKKAKHGATIEQSNVVNAKLNKFLF